MYEYLAKITTLEFITVVILDIIYVATFCVFLTIMVYVNKISDRVDISINLMLICLQLCALFSVADFSMQIYYYFIQDSSDFYKGYKLYGCLYDVCSETMPFLFL